MRNIKIFGFADEAATDIDGQIKALKRNGLCGLEIRGVDGQNISDITLEKAKEVKAKLDFEGLSVWSIGSPIGKIEVTDDFEAHKELVPMQPGDVPVTYADTDPLERDFGFRPNTPLRTGLRKFAKWYKEFYG